MAALNKRLTKLKVDPSDGSLRGYVFVRLPDADAARDILATTTVQQNRTTGSKTEGI
jgi:hypothetical protein